MRKSLEMIGKICAAGIVILLVVIVVGAVCLWRESGKEQEPPVTLTETEKEELADERTFLPSNLRLGEKLPMNWFQDAQGNSVDLQEKYEGKNRILVFWGSWCRYCDRTLQSIGDCTELLEKYKDIELILINKTDEQKEETVEKAEAYLQEEGIDLPHYYDINLEAYQSYGIKRIPTILMLDGEGYVRDMSAEMVESVSEWEQIFENVQSGKDREIFCRIEKEWMGEEGQVYTSRKKLQSSVPSGQDILCESQGLIMEYAVKTEKKELFEKADSFLQSKMKRDQVYAWYLKEDGKQADANAVLDDLRIYQALAMADELWGGQKEKMQALAQGILEHNTEGNRLYSFYDFSQKKPGKEIALCYVDLVTLDGMGEQREEFRSVTENMTGILESGYISDEFPLYYAAYDYETGKYENESLHTAEALLTLYHLAQADRMKETSLEWLREKLSGRGLSARYGTDGEVVPGYEYESTAVYAIAALIGAEEKDSDIYTKSIQKMEILTEQHTDTDGMRVFDLLMPMMAYAEGAQIQFD